MTSLRTNIHALCNDHLTTTPFGTATATPLLTQLEQAIKPNKGGGKSGSSGKSEVINLTALALWEEISADIGIHTMEAGMTPKQDRIEALRQWTELEDDADWADFLEHVTLDWCDRISALVSPVKPYHPHHPCPACGVQFHGEDRTAPLSVHHIGDDGKQLHPHQWRMECSSCGAEWEGNTLGAMAKAMSA